MEKKIKSIEQEWTRIWKAISKNGKKIESIEQEMVKKIKNLKLD